MSQTQSATLLPLMIRLTAIGYLLFFIPNLLLAATHHIHTLPPSVARLFDWGGSADATAVMLSTAMWCGRYSCFTRRALHSHTDFSLIST